MVVLNFTTLQHTIFFRFLIFDLMTKIFPFEKPLEVYTALYQKLSWGTNHKFLLPKQCEKSSVTTLAVSLYCTQRGSVLGVGAG